jgi:hypothetical protein
MFGEKYSYHKTGFSVDKPTPPLYSALRETTICCKEKEVWPMIVKMGLPRSRRIDAFPLGAKNNF